jgi:hypothetical protein
MFDRVILELLNEFGGTGDVFKPRVTGYISRYVVSIERDRFLRK